MSKKNLNIYAGLKRLFHEPSRLAMISSLCRDRDGLTFNELKTECKLSFGNLSSHLKILKEAGVIDVKKEFINNKPRTTVLLTDQGRNQFIQYIQVLEKVLKNAAQAVSSDEQNLKEYLFSGDPDFQVQK